MSSSESTIRNAPPAAAPSGDAAPADSTAKVVLRRGRARPLWFGHPWVYANAVDRIEGQANAGDAVSLADHDGRLIGRGFYNPRSQIPVRLCTRRDEPLHAAFFRARIAEAKALRARLGLPSTRTTAYRLINSEGDALPGLVVDVYGDAAVAQLTTLGMAQRRAEIFDALEAELGCRTIFETAAASYADLEGFQAVSRVARGASRVSAPCLVPGSQLEALRLGGQMPGLSLAPRDNRACFPTRARFPRWSRN